MKPADGRFALYLLAPLVGTFLGTLPGFTYDAARGLVTMHVETALIGLGGGIAMASAIYARWAKR